MGEMHALLPRIAAARLHRSLQIFPVVIVSGARQTGKSTLVRHQLQGPWRYSTLDDVLLRDEAQRDPEAFLDRARDLIVDEVQRAPELLLAIKRRVDEARTPGRYILTGSVDFALQRGVSESLAGRAAYIVLHPLTRQEAKGHARAGRWSELLTNHVAAWRDLLEAAPSDGGHFDPEPWQAWALRGGYPIPAHELATTEAREAWFEAYAATYLERDLRALSDVHNLADMRRLMRALALRTGSLLNQAEVARDLSLAPSTVQRFVNLLEVSVQLTRLNAFATNRTRRMIKAPKLYWNDTGLGLHLSGETEPRGPHLENLILNDLTAWADVQPRAVSLLHWRTAAGAEVDVVIETPTTRLAVEVKSTRRPTPHDARHLLRLLAEERDFAGGLLLHAGDDIVHLAPNVVAAPWWRVV